MDNTLKRLSGKSLMSEDLDSCMDIEESVSCESCSSDDNKADDY